MVARRESYRAGPPGAGRRGEGNWEQVNAEAGEEGESVGAG